MENYIVAVGNLNFNLMDVKIVKIIHQTIYRMYEDGLDFWPDNMI